MNSAGGWVTYGVLRATNSRRGTCMQHKDTVNRLVALTCGLPSDFSIRKASNNDTHVIIVIVNSRVPILI